MCAADFAAVLAVDYRVSELFARFWIFCRFYVTCPLVLTRRGFLALFWDDTHTHHFLCVVFLLEIRLPEPTADVKQVENISLVRVAAH